MQQTNYSLLRNVGSCKSYSLKECSCSKLFSSGHCFICKKRGHVLFTISCGSLHYLINTRAPSWTLTYVRTKLSFSPLSSNNKQVTWVRGQIKASGVGQRSNGRNLTSQVYEIVHDVNECTVTAKRKKGRNVKMKHCKQSCYQTKYSNC